MPNGHLKFPQPQSLAQSLKLNITDKCHVFPGGRISGQKVSIRARNITIEASGSLFTQSSGVKMGAGNGKFSLLIQ